MLLLGHVNKILSILISKLSECPNTRSASARSAKERFTQHMPVEHHCSQVDQQTSLFGMHFYGMGSWLYTRRVWSPVCITDRPYL